MRRSFLPLDEWFKILPRRSQWMSGVFCPYSAAFILALHLGEWWCAPRVVMCIVMIDDSFYGGLYPVGNLKTVAIMG